MNITPSGTSQNILTVPPNEQKHTKRVERIKNIAFAVIYALAATALCAATAATFVITSPIVATAYLVTSIACAILGSIILASYIIPRLPETPKRIANFIKTIFVELSLLPIAATLFLFSLERKEKATLEKLIKNPQQAKDTPILMVHGFLHNSTAWAFQKKQLEKEGFGPIYTIDLGSPFKSVDTYAQQVKKKADDIAKAHGRDDLIIVSHSMGGLVSTQYATKYAKPGTVRKIITLGTPAQGTIAAYIGSFITAWQSKCAKDMYPRSALIKNLETELSKHPEIPICNLTSKTDEIIVPNSYAKFAKGNVSQYSFEDMGHLQYLYSGRVLDTLIKELRPNNARVATV